MASVRGLTIKNKETEYISAYFSEDSDCDGAPPSLFELRAPKTSTASVHAHTHSALAVYKGGTARAVFGSSGNVLASQDKHR